MMKKKEEGGGETKAGQHPLQICAVPVHSPEEEP